MKLGTLKISDIENINVDLSGLDVNELLNKKINECIDKTIHMSINISNLFPDNDKNFQKLSDPKYAKHEFTSLLFKKLYESTENKNLYDYELINAYPYSIDLSVTTTDTFDPEKFLDQLNNDLQQRFNKIIKSLDFEDYNSKKIDNKKRNKLFKNQ